MSGKASGNLVVGPDIGTGVVAIVGEVNPEGEIQIIGRYPAVAWPEARRGGEYRVHRAVDSARAY